MSGEDFRRGPEICPDTFLADARRAFAERKAALGMDGFLDPDTARRCVRRLRLRTALRAMEKSVPALLDRLDEARKADSDATFAPRERGGVLAGGDGEGGVGGWPIDAIKRQDMREQQLLEGADLILQLLDAIFDGLGHGLFSGRVADARKGNRAAPGAVSLCGGGK